MRIAPYIKLMLVGDHFLAGTYQPQPMIKIQGEFLSTYGFTLRELITVSGNQNTIQLTPIGKGKQTYLKHVAQIRQNKQQLIEVQMRTTGQNPKRPTHQLCLTLEGWLLSRFKYQIGDVILLTCSQGIIQIKKVDPLSLGFDAQMQFRIFTVYHMKKRKIEVPSIQLMGQWIDECGFSINHYADMVFTDDAMIFTPTTQRQPRIRKGTFPKQINVTTYRRASKVYAKLAVSGKWLLNAGYESGDTLLVGYKKGCLRLRRTCFISLI